MDLYTRLRQLRAELTASRCRQQREHLEKRRLAATVHADQDLERLQLEIDVEQAAVAVDAQARQLHGP
jgi:hypothetical protein